MIKIKIIFKQEPLKKPRRKEPCYFQTVDLRPWLNDWQTIYIYFIFFLFAYIKSPMPILILTYSNFYIQRNIQRGKLKLKFREVRFAAMLHETESSTVWLLRFSRMNRAKENRGLLERIENDCWRRHFFYNLRESSMFPELPTKTVGVFKPNSWLFVVPASSNMHFLK